VDWATNSPRFCCDPLMQGLPRLLIALKVALLLVGLILALVLWTGFGTAAVSLAAFPASRGAAAVAALMVLSEVAIVAWLILASRQRAADAIRFASVALWISNTVNLALLALYPAVL
jgi:hypothetical protein